MDFEGDDDDDDMKASGDLSADLAKVQLEQEEKVVLSKDQLSEVFFLSLNDIICTCIVLNVVIQQNSGRRNLASMS